MKSIFAREINRFYPNKIQQKKQSKSDQRTNKLKKFASSNLPTNLIYDYAVFDWDVRSHDYGIPQDVPMLDSWRRIRGLATVSWFEDMNDYPVFSIAEKISQSSKRKAKKVSEVYTDLLKGLALLSDQVCPNFLDEEDPEISQEWIAASERAIAYHGAQLLSASLPSDLQSKYLELVKPKYD